MEHIPSSMAIDRNRAVNDFPRTVGVDSCPRARRGSITLETLLYALILVAALLTRFWDLGSRALHHDESLHAYFSWLYATGYGYIHNPLMHGPALFTANALVDLLFGATDATSRLAPAMCGVIVVMLPYLLRSERLLGRWGALCASLLLLISPSILYYSRFERHDIYCLVGTFTLFCALVRYVDSREPRWAFLAALMVGYLLSTEEVSFIVLFVFSVFLGAVIVYRIAPILFAVAVGALVALGATFKLLRLIGAPPLPSIPWENPTNDNVRQFTFQLITHPLVVAAVGLLLLTIVAALWVLDRKRDKERGWIDGILGDAPEYSTAAALRDLLYHPRAALWGLALGAALFVLLYSSFFMNMMGLASGTFGALGYWLGQQGVQRGEEPWYYYLLLLPQYEYVAVVLFPLAAGWLGLTALRQHREGIPFDRRTHMRALLLWWSIGMLAVLSWAGEKMPWISVHVVLPLTLLAASYLGEAITRVEARAGLRRMLAFGGAVIAMLAAAFLAMAWASSGPYVSTSLGLERVARANALAHWWIPVYLPWIVLAGLVGFGAWKLGARQTLLTLLVAGAIGLSLAELHAGWRLTYQEGDVPKDMLIYVQTSPDVPRLADDLTTLSQQTTGGMNLEVWYDDVTQWPLNWYLRDFPYRHYFGTQLPNQTMTAPVVIVADEYVTPAMEQQLQNYTAQEYPLRWWFPEEETYRRFAYAPDLKNTGRQNYQDSRKPPFTLIDTAGSALRSIASLRHPQEQARIFRLVAYRETPVGLGSVRFRVYVRNDLMPTFNSVRYGTDR